MTSKLLDELNAALEADNVTGAEMLRKLDEIYVALSAIASNPITGSSTAVIKRIDNKEIIA